MYARSAGRISKAKTVGLQVYVAVASLPRRLLIPNRPPRSYFGLTCTSFECIFIAPWEQNDTTNIEQNAVMVITFQQ